MALLGPGEEAAEPGVAKTGRSAKSQESTTVHVHIRYVQCPLTISFCIMSLGSLAFGQRLWSGTLQVPPELPDQVEGALVPLFNGLGRRRSGGAADV